jgi:hypothetical protein
MTAFAIRCNPHRLNRYWDWNSLAIEYEGRILRSEKVAIVTGDAAVQGAMMISAEPVNSALDPGKPALFVELLFTAPRNRPVLRTDGKPYLVGVGTSLLTWAVSFSICNGCEGRLILDGSPDYLGWYEKRGLQRLNKDPIVYEGTNYTPMQLSPPAARRLLAGI